MCGIFSACSVSSTVVLVCKLQEAEKCMQCVLTPCPCVFWSSSIGEVQRHSGVGGRFGLGARALRGGKGNYVLFLLINFFVRIRFSALIYLYVAARDDGGWPPHPFILVGPCDSHDILSWYIPFFVIGVSGSCQPPTTYLESSIKKKKTRTASRWFHLLKSSANTHVSMFMHWFLVSVRVSWRAPWISVILDLYIPKKARKHVRHISHISWVKFVE